MKSYDMQGIDLLVPRERAFAFIADPQQLPRWTNAFASVAEGRALMRTPNGEVEISLAVRSSVEHGTVDWLMTFPDGGVATAFSRVIELDRERCLFSTGRLSQASVASPRGHHCVHDRAVRTGEQYQRLSMPATRRYGDIPRAREPLAAAVCFVTGAGEAVSARVTRDQESRRGAACSGPVPLPSGTKARKGFCFLVEEIARE